MPNSSQPPNYQPKSEPDQDQYKSGDFPLIAAAASQHGITEQRALRDYLVSGEITDVPYDERAELMVALARYMQIDPLERPFLIIREKMGKDEAGNPIHRDVLYASKACTTALARTRKVSRKIIAREETVIAGQPVLIVRAQASLPNGRTEEAIGAVPLKVLAWGDLRGKRVWRDPTPAEAANLPMKAETKAKRRVTLDLVGLGMPDESDLEDRGGTVQRLAHPDMSVAPLPPVKQPDELLELIESSKPPTSKAESPNADEIPPEQTEPEVAR